MSELISVIAPIYKVEKYLPKCLETIVNQSYKNLEIILVDDGSPDNCGAICDEWAARDSRIKVVHQQNKGVSGARNAGLDAVTGEWVMQIDPDDYVHTDIIKTLYETARDTGAEMVWCNYEEVSEDGLRADGTAADPNDKEAVKNPEITLLTRQEAEKCFFGMELKQESLVPWCKLCRAELFTRNTSNRDDNYGRVIRYPEGRIFEDGYTTYLLIYEANKTAVVRSKLYYYRQHGGSIMDVNTFKTFEPALDGGLRRMIFYRDRDEKELYYSETNLNMYLVITYYGKTKDAKVRAYLKNWYKTYYNEHFKKQKWSFAKRVRLGAFYYSYPLYNIISSFEKLYNNV